MDEEMTSSMRWYTQRKQELATERGRIPEKSYELKPVQRAALAGVLPGNWGTDHLRELESFKSWTYHAVHTVAKMYALASVSVTVCPQAVAKGYGSAQDSPDEEWKPDRKHPAFKLLSRPNKFVSGLKFRYQMAQQIRLTGGALIWEVPNQLGKPCELWVLPRAWAVPQMPTREHPFGYYRITPYRSYWTQYFNFPFAVTSYNVDARETILIGWPNPLRPGDCTSPLAACDKLIDTANMTETAVWASMFNGVKPSLALTIDPRSGVAPTEEQLEQMEQKIAEFKAGPHNAGKILALIGLAVQPLSLSPTDLGAVENRSQNQEFVYNTQGVTATAVGKVEQTSYSAAAVAMNTMVETGIQPDLDAVGDAMTHRWQYVWGEPTGGQEFKVCLDAKRFDDPTLDLQWADKKNAGYTAGYVTGNEVRSALKLPPRPELDELKKPDPAPGMPGMPGAGPPGAQPPQAHDDPLAAFDMEDEPGSDEGTGIKQPTLQAASGNRMPAFSTNGVH